MTFDFQLAQGFMTLRQFSTMSATVDTGSGFRGLLMGCRDDSFGLVLLAWTCSFVLSFVGLASPPKP